MAKQMKCVFKRVNGDKTGVFCRTGMGKSYKSPGILYMSKCPDGKSFLCDPNDGGTNSYYRLIDPSKYGLPNQKMYVYLDDSFIQSRTIIDDKPAPTPPPKPAEKPKESPVPPKKDAVEKGDIQGLNMGQDSGGWNKGYGVNTTSSINVKEGAILTIPPNQYSYGSIVRYSYLNDYTYLQNSLDIVEKNLNLSMGASTLADLKADMVEKFNRFKIAYPDIQLSKTFAQVFFTRPDLNIYNSQGSGNYTLTDQASNDPVYYYLHRNNPDLLLSLTKDFSSLHDFNPFLSNMAQSFELADEYIKTMEHGETFTGYKVKYGKNNIESKTAGSISISYIDDDEYKVYKLHKAWVDYISKVFRGEFVAKSDYIRYRAIDYAVSVYYFLCGPDGETILFWSKYTGIFPTNIPSAVSSWSKGNMVKMPEYSINYDYSWKEDFNPVSLAEFNKNSKGDTKYKYITTYEPELLTTGKTFTGAPFVETSIDAAGGYTFKLKFRAL